MARRTSVAQRVEDLAGRNLIRITAIQNGWPTLAEIQANGDVYQVAMFVAPNR